MVFAADVDGIASFCVGSGIARPLVGPVQDRLALNRRACCGRRPALATTGVTRHVQRMMQSSAESSLPHRVSGNLALDLANTVTWRGTGREVDHVADAEGILAWARSAGLIDQSYRLSAASMPALVADIHGLRDAVIGAGAAVAAGLEPPQKNLAVIAAMASDSLANGSLRGAPAALLFTPEKQITGPIAWAALDLFRGGELDRLKQCPPDNCRWLFLDRTKNGSRRWCDMATCGNREKARRYR